MFSTEEIQAEYRAQTPVILTEREAREQGLTIKTLCYGEIRQPYRVQLEAHETNGLVSAE